MDNEHNRNMPTEEELRGIFKVLGEEVPGLLEKLTKILYGIKEGEDLGKAVGNFLKELVQRGMPPTRLGSWPTSTRRWPASEMSWAWPRHGRGGAA